MTGSAPRCRFCGAPIPKRTAVVAFGSDENSRSPRGGWICRTERPATRKEAERILGLPVVETLYSNVGDLYISRARVHRDEYRDDLFCSEEHAARFGRALAERGYLMPALMEKLGGKR